MPSADTAGMFSSAIALHDKAIPSPLPAEWWVETCAVVDVTSVRLVGIWWVLQGSRRVPSLTSRPWWPALLELAIANANVNVAVGLTARATASFSALCLPIAILEAAAKDES